LPFILNPSPLIARRYLFARKNISLISTLTSISIAGVTIGTALLIVVLSVFNGFFDLIKNMLLAYDPDIRIEASFGRDMHLSENQLDFLHSHPSILVISPFAEGRALISHRGDTYKVAIVRGVDQQTFPDMVSLEVDFSGAPFDLGVHDRTPGMLMGRALMGQLGLQKGDEVALLSAQSIQRSLTQFSGPRLFNFDLRGVYMMDEMYDGSVIFVDKRAAQRLFNMRTAISGVDIKLTNHELAESVKQELITFFGDEFNVRSWYDLQKPLYDVMNLEKWGAFVILMIIVIVAALNIVGSLTMVVIQKTRDIALLLSIGFRQRDIRNIFLRQGVYIGIIGCGIGGAIGLVLCWLQDTFGFVKLAGAEAFIIDAYPVAVSAFDVTLVLIGSLFLCLAASLYPAIRASSVTISDALRYE